ncbi:hypothetical protein MMC18_008007 [Xylographa bjoerkii]|nr:hypothetical protein [Xylographa bjoerkii]
MKLSLSLLSTILFTTTILARPHSRAERRATRTLKSQPLIPYTGPAGPDPVPDSSNVQYSDNWSGAVLTAPPAGQTFNAVSGTFTVPTVSPPSGAGSGSWASSAWVGIDGDTYGNAILQTGIDFTVTKSGGSTSQSFQAWYEWYPNDAFNFAMDVSAGDVIALSVVSSSASAGTVTIKNVSSGASVSKALKAPGSGSHLGGQNAEWIVEDFEEGGSLVALSNFGTVTFTDCVAKTSSEKLGLSGATIIDIKQSGKVETSVTVESSSSVQIKYV